MHARKFAFRFKQADAMATTFAYDFDFPLFSPYFRGNTVQWNIDDNV
jgi:hypothetical protein